MPNTGGVNTELVNGDGESFFEGIFTDFIQNVEIISEEGVFAELRQSVGIARSEAIFTTINQTVQLRSVNESGDFVSFYQDVQKTIDEQNAVTLNQKVIT